MLSFAGLGHSHIVSLARGSYALQARSALVGGEPIEGAFHYLYDPAYTPEVSPETGTLHPRILQAIGREGLRFLLLSVGGNEHNVLSIAQLDQKFDFMLGEALDLPLAENCEIVPEVVLRETVREWMAPKIAIMKALRAATTLPMVQIEPPPPLPREQVLNYPKEFFRRAVDARKLSPDLLRHKMWRLQIGLYRELCASLGISYVRTPAEMIDGHGMLARKAWGQDATHANEWFGETMVLAACTLVQSAGKE